MKRPSVTEIAAAPPPVRNLHAALALHDAFRRGAAASALLVLSGCYYYPYGYAPYYAGPVPVASTQQETVIAQTAPNPAPVALPDAQYPGPLYPSPPVAVAAPAWPAYPVAYPAYYPYPAYPAYGWGWGAPAVSFGFGYWGGGGHGHHR
ncbi:hypothetical protein [Paraburkholderia lycopersici]|uniref:PXPV repeat-containing protein n=1 Tax=Paraburkholderia lycopersici TaxID=416944 RepID=A0A1G6I6Z5_9BURK|nr:hypothetical protein [Paraburkholderia lycopersici]SDC02312.1 hypothetical protein SAMN05421548_103285 [Paraburkholderia lycopersici]